MKSLLDSSSTTIFFFFVALLMISTNTPTCHCDYDYDRYKHCNNAFICGNGNISKNLKWPFYWVESNCSGIAYMDLTCEESVPKMGIGDIKYRILDWDITTLRLKVARDDYWGDVCGVPGYYNSTFEATYFQRAGDEFDYVALLYNCDAKGNLPNGFYNTTCGGGGGGGDTTVVYTVDNPSSAPCSGDVTVVTIPIMRTTLVNTSLTEVIQEGFELTYTGDEFSVCGRCVDSGGVCGSWDRATTDFSCLCKDGAYNTTTCNSLKATSSISPISPIFQPKPIFEPKPIFQPKKGSKWKYRLIVIGALVAGFAVLILFIVMMRRRGIGGQKWIFWKRRKFVDHNDKAFNQNYDSIMPKRYNSAELKRITNSFRDELGKGGFGIVYKGCLPDGRLVAVKVIKESKGNGEDFINEVVSICRTSHVNIVSLLGFCYEVNERALIFEFMPNGSLDKFIYRSGFPNAICDFDWNTLFQIAIGIAQGLEYLHKKCASRILHLDIKPQNILLDEDFCPKISDFGLTKICQKKESIVSIPSTRGTIGYMAPEVFSRAFGGVSDKSDVYSYGMLVLEIIGGKNNHDTGGSRSTEMYFPDWIYKDLEQGNTGVNWLAISEEENDTVRKITMVSLWCIQTNPLDRPSMKKVIEWLEGPLQLVPYPPNPSIYSPERPPLQISSMSSGTLYETNSITT